MTDNIADEEEHMLAAEYALGLLSPDEALAFENLMAVDAPSREAYAFWAAHFVSLTDDVAEVAPPSRVWDGIRGILFEEKKSSWLQRLGLLPAVGGGLLAAVVALWVIDLSFGNAINPPTATAVLTAEAGGLVVEIGYADNGETLQVARLSGEMPEGQALELWLLKDDQPPISLGVLPRDETGRLEVAENIRPLLHGAKCAISIEPLGGSPTGAPTGEIIAVAPIVWKA